MTEGAHGVDGWFHGGKADFEISEALERVTWDFIGCEEGLLVVRLHSMFFVAISSLLLNFHSSSHLDFRLPCCFPSSRESQLSQWYGILSQRPEPRGA